MDNFDTYVQIATELRETYEDFIFNTISPFITQETQLIINKQELVDALKLYKNREDYEKVVHCKDCNFFCMPRHKPGEQVTEMICTRFNRVTKENDYCSKGIKWQ